MYELDLLVGSITGKKNLVGFGVNFEKLDYETSSTLLESEDNIDYYLKWTYDSYDRAVFPNKGTLLKYTWAIDFAHIFEDDKLYNCVDLYLSNYVPINEKLSLISAISIDKITGEDKKDIHEKDKEYLEKSHKNACDIAERLEWKEIHCVNKNGEIKSIEEIHEEIYNVIKKVIS